jgi:hypothetical protein
MYDVALAEEKSRSAQAADCAMPWRSGRRLDHACRLPAPIFADGHALPAFRQLNEVWTVTGRYDALAGAAGKPVEQAPLVK